MTSRISFFRLQMEDLRHRIALIMVTCFVFFMKELFFLLSLQNASMLSDGPDTMSAIWRTISEFARPGFIHFLYAFPLAVLMGINAVHYLHNKNRVDFMNALPIRRRSMFGLILINSVLIFAVPYLISMVAHTVIAAAFCNLNHTYFVWMAEGMLATGITFLLTYLLMMAAMLLTGQIFVGFLAFGTMASYGPIVIRYLIDSLGDVFFRTYGGLTSGQEKFFDVTSPVYTGLCLMTEEHKSYYYLAAMIWLVLLAVCTYLLFLKRPSEKAGSAMAFAHGQKLIKTLVTIPMALYIGIFLYQLSVAQSRVWFVLGALIGAILFHGLVECIYRSDARGMWSCKKDLGILIVITFLITAAYATDLMGYDRFLPDTSDVERVKVSGIENDNITDYEDGYDYATKGQGIRGPVKDELIEYMKQFVDGEAKDSEMIRNIRVSYSLANGKTKIRSYDITDKDIENLLGILYKSEEYKEQHFPVFKTKADQIEEIYVHHPVADCMLNDLTSQEKQELLDTYCQELRNLSEEEVKEGHLVCKLDIVYCREANEEGNNMNVVYPVFPSFTRTLDFLKAHGTTSEMKVEDYPISSLEVNCRKEDGMYASYSIDDVAFIRQIQNQLYFSELNYLEMDCYGSHDMEIYGIYGDSILYLDSDEEARELILQKIQER